MTKKKINDIKHGERVFFILDNIGLASFSDIESASNLDRKTLQTVLNRLKKNGFAEKTARGWQSLR